MHELTKIKDVSSKYAITARTLRYYEDIGILKSVRSEGYAHRMYDEAAITRLKQILILRKLNISVKDIKSIFAAADSAVVLEVLGKKAEDIEDEVALLHELKTIVLEFIKQIKQSDFHNESEVKRLYDKATEIETQLTTADYIVKVENANEITDVNLSEMIPVYEEDEPKGAQTGKYSFTDQGELVITSIGWDDLDFIGLQTMENFTLPLRIDLVVKSDGDIWLHYNKGGLCLNHNNYGTDLYYIHANDIFTGQHTSYPVPKLSLCEYTEVSWVLDYNEAQVFLNGGHYHTHVWSDSSMSLAEKKKILSPVDVMAGAGNTVTVKSLKVTGAKMTGTGLTTSDIRLQEVTEKLDEKRITLPTAVRAYRQSVGPMRFIGKKYESGGEAWNNWTDVWDNESDQWLIKRMGIDPKALYEDGDSLVGLMSHRNGFEYWLGYFTPANTPVPEGFEYEDFPKMDIGTCWLYGHNDDVIGVESIAFEKLKEEGYEVIDNDTSWWFERYHPMRNREDKNGNVIIDICFFVN